MTARSKKHKRPDSGSLIVGRILPWLAVILILSVLAGTALILPSEALRLGRGTLEELAGEWTIMTADGQVRRMPLPVELYLEPGELYQAQYRFRHDYPEGMQLRVRASMQTIRILLNDTELFVSAEPPSGRPQVPPASVWYFVPIQSDLENKTLTIEMSSPVRAFSGTVNPVVIGGGDALLYQLIVEKTPDILIVLFLLVFALLSITAAILIRRLPDNSLLYLGFFALCTGVWILSEARLLQLITGNRFVLGSISYLMIVLAPISFLLYLRASILRRYGRLLAGITIVFGLIFTLVLTAQLTGIATFIETAALTNMLTAISVLLVIVLAFRDMIKHKNKPARNFLLFSCLMAFTVLTEILNFFIRNFDVISQFSRIGIIIFFIFLASDSIRSVNRLLEQEKHGRLMSKLAYTDMLTGAGNRLAFEQDLISRFDSPDHSCQVCRLILMDINNLKRINDEHGHRAGDQAIRLCYETIVQAIGEHGHCYRMGGDEFACIVPDCDDASFRQIMDQIHRNTLDAAADLPFELQMAIGSDCFSARDAIFFDDFYHHVDQLMYSQKKEMKNLTAEPETEQAAKADPEAEAEPAH